MKCIEVLEQTRHPGRINKLHFVMTTLCYQVKLATTSHSQMLCSFALLTEKSGKVRSGFGCHLAPDAVLWRSLTPLQEKNERNIGISKKDWKSRSRLKTQDHGIMASWPILCTSLYIFTSLSKTCEFLMCDPTLSSLVSYRTWLYTSWSNCSKTCFTLYVLREIQRKFEKQN